MVNEERLPVPFGAPHHLPVDETLSDPDLTSA